MTGNTGNQPTLRQQFLTAVRTGELGRQEEYGVEVTVKAFKAFFPDINRNYVNSFLATATLEPGRTQMANTKYVIRLHKGVIGAS